MLRRIRPHRRAAALSGAAALGVSGALVLGIGLTGQERVEPVADAAATATATSTPPSPGGPAPVPAPAAAPTSLPAAHYTPSSAVRVQIPAVDLDLPVLGLIPRRGVIDPPMLTAAYWIEPYGQPVAAPDQAGNTIYLAAHSAGRGDDGFDPLMTPDHRGSALAEGDTIEVQTPGGTGTYTVQRTARYGKGELADAAEVWEAKPGRLVLITCFQRRDGRASTENLVVFAEA